MSLAFKVLTLFSVVCVVTSYINIRGDAPWFTSRQRITDSFMMGNIKGRNTLCTARRQGVATQGVCKPLKECLLRGGTNGGSCALLGSCCILERSCTNTTSAKVAYFVSPLVLQPQCSLTVNLFNTDVCQIRLDFEQFSIAQPSRDIAQGLGVFEPNECNNDIFTVTGSAGNLNLGFVHLCGENANQHIYVPVNSTTGLRSISLNFQLLANRNATNGVPGGYIDPRWRIRVTQLECQANAAVNFNNIQSALFSMYQKFKNKKNNNAQTDAPLIAPPGCLQYYPETTGTYESFNYNGGLGPYIANLNYAICFRRNADTCGISHTPVSFRMNSNPALGNCRSPIGANANISSDYITIPGGVILGNNDAAANVTDIYCNQDLNTTTTITSAMAGPLYVVVRTDEFTGNGDLASEIGFRFTYAVLNSNCGV